MKKYVKEIDGKNVIKTRSQIIITKNDMITYNPTDEMILEDGWVEYIASYEESIEDVRRNKTEEIESYDKSNDVNIFYVENIPVWLDKSTRAGLILRFNAEKDLGKTETSLWYDGMEFQLPIEIAIKLLYAIEVYASKCYDNTQKHLSIINKLENIEEIENYNFKTDYPEPLRFNL